MLLHVRDALAVDGRVGELGLDVCIERQRVVVRGAVSTDARRAEIATLVHGVLTASDLDLPVDNLTHVPGAGEPTDEPEQM